MNLNLKTKMSICMENTCSYENLELLIWWLIIDLVANYEFCDWIKHH